MKPRRMDRRAFLKATGAFGAVQILSGCFSPGAYRANERVRLGCVGIGHQAWNDIRKFEKTGLCDIAALCDVDPGGTQCVPAFRAYPGASRFTDFRRMLDAMSDRLDAVAVMTPDHSHFPALVGAMRRGLAVFSEKPLGHSFRENELLLAAARKSGVVTQMGNQGHSEANLYQFRHYVESGIIDPAKAVRLVAHMNEDRRWYKFGAKVAAYPAAEALPKDFDWNAWVAGAVDHGFSKRYLDGEWRSWYDYGSGCLGDWGAHTMDTIHRFFELGLPTAVEIADVKGWNPYVFPLQDTLRFAFPAKGKRGGITLEWREGVGNHPEFPGDYRKSFNLVRGEYVKPGKFIVMRDGEAWQGSSHGSTLVRCSDGSAPEYPAPATDELTHYRNFLRAVQGAEKPNSPFEVAVPLCEVFSLGIIAQRLNRGFRFDPAFKRAVGDDEANLLLAGPAPRKEWDEYYRER